MTNIKLYFPIANLSAIDYLKLAKQLSKRFKDPLPESVSESNRIKENRY